MIEHAILRIPLRSRTGCCRLEMLGWPVQASDPYMSAEIMVPWQTPRSLQRVAKQKTQRTLVAFQYGLLTLSGIDSAGAIYLILGPGDEVTIAGASPILTAVSTIFVPHKLPTLKLYQPGGSVRHILAAPSDRLLAILQEWPTSLSSTKEHFALRVLDDIQGYGLVLGGSSSARISNGIQGTVLRSQWKRSPRRC